MKAKISKLESALQMGKLPIKRGDVVLYLGAAHGSTAKIIADIVGEDGFVFCLDFAYDSVKSLARVCKQHSNMCPLMFDASFPDKYSGKVEGITLIYQDIAQRNQAEILLKNAKLFLKKGHYALMCLKIRAVDSVAHEQEVMTQVVKKLSEMFFIEKIINISRTHKGHRFIVLKKK